MISSIIFASLNILFFFFFLLLKSPKKLQEDINVARIYILRRKYTHVRYLLRCMLCKITCSNNRFKNAVQSKSFFFFFMNNIKNKMPYFYVVKTREQENHKNKCTNKNTQDL